MKRHLFVILCLLCALHLWANPVTVDQARQKAAAFFQNQQTLGARRRAPAARQLRLAAQGRDATYYIYNAPNDGDGYVVVSGDDATEEILGYSNTGTINPDNMPCGLRVLLNDYADQIAFLRKNGITREMNSPRKKVYKEGSTSEISSFKVDKRRLTSYYQVEPPKNQNGHPFNALCPIENGYTGCVATAMSGLMYAYKWPKKTMSTIPDYSFYLGFVKYKGIPNGTKIDWSNIKSKYEVNAAGDSAYAIANLLKVTGASVKTSYEYIDPDPNSEIGSSADTKEVADALKKYFGYDESVVFRDRSDYNNNEWRDMLRKELIENGPVVYRGYEKRIGGGSHAFLLEGFNGNYFNVNWGWGYGSKDDKYLLDVLDYDDEDVGFNYPYKQGAVFNVRPIPHAEVEVTGLRFDNASHTGHSINGAGVRSAPEVITFAEDKLRGSITFHNKGENKSWKFFFLQLRDVEKPDTLYRTIFKTLLPDETYTYNFSFSDLTIGHHYVLSSLDLFGDEFFQSTELLCVEDSAFVDAENDNGPMKLTRFEYWFDDNFKDIRTATLTKSESVVRGNIATDNLEDGFHLLHFRVKRDAGDYQFSSVNTTPFLKLTKEQEGHLDYWIDDNRDGMKTLPLADTEDEQLLELDLSDDAFCSPGFHRLNIQVATKGSVMGSVQSQGVLKLAKGVAGELEYWFDNDVKHSQKLTGKRSYADDGYIYISELDLSGLTPGQHRLNFRAVSSTGITAGSVLSCTVMKLSTGKATQLEYWFDDDTANRYFLDGTADGDCYVYDYMLDMSDLPFGLHRLNIRPTSTDGSNKGSLVTSNVLKVGTGSVKTLEYWFDGDIAHSRTLGVQSGEGADFVFADDLNLNGIAPGHHRLYCRAIGDDPTTTTAIVSYAVVVKLRYGADGDATMASYSLTLDNDSVVAYGQLSARSEVVFNYTLDASELAEGTHTLKATFWNSFGASVTDVTPFWVRGALDGDVNADGQVGIGDIVAITNYMAGMTNGVTLEQADVNGDGEVGIGDIVAITNIMAGVTH